MTRCESCGALFGHHPRCARAISYDNPWVLLERQREANRVLRRRLRVRQAELRTRTANAALPKGT